MKKILFKSIHLGIGGVERTQVQYINYLQENNYDTSVLMEIDNGSNNIIDFSQNIPITFIKNISQAEKLKQVRNEKNISLKHKIRYNLELIKDKSASNNVFKQVTKELQPDIAINFHPAANTWNWKYIQNAKSIAWIHNSIVRKFITFNNMQKYIKKLSKYDLIVCVSQGVANEITELAPELEHKITYLHNPINFERIKKLSNEEIFIDEKFLLMVARFDIASKDHYTLFTAFDIAKENGYDGKLYVIGDGNNEEKAIINTLLDMCKYKNDIKLLGAKINPFNWMKKCDKFILSTKSEGLPTVLLEALAVNDIVISANCKSGPSEILDNGQCGYLFDVGNYHKLAEFMLDAKPKDRKLIDNHLLQFSNEVIMQKFHNILEQI